MTDSQAIGSERRAASRRTLSRASVVALFFVLLGVLGLVAGFILQAHVEQRRSVAQQAAAAYVEMLGVRLNETMGAAYLMAGAIIQDQGKNPGRLLDAMAPLLLKQFPLVDAVQVAPNGVLRYSYPLKEHQAAIGHDLLVDRTRNQEAHLAVSTRKLTLAGPFPLIQGGLGVVARFPVFINNADGWPKFWGFTTTLVRIPALLDAAGIVDIQRAGYHYSLCRTRDKNGCEVFAARGSSLSTDPVTATLAVPNGQWVLAVSPERGWWRPEEVGFAALLCIALAAAQTVLILNFFRARDVRRRQG